MALIVKLADMVQIQVMDGVPLHGGNMLPITGSHEAVGIIDKMGPDVDTTRFKIGDRVGTLNYYHPCGNQVNHGSC
jgi:D-arabinose 1-dehydrogenase-like Zn-dependent alcohol dehydrogenase